MYYNITIMDGKHRLILNNNEHHVGNTARLIRSTGHVALVNDTTITIQFSDLIKIIPDQDLVEFDVNNSEIKQHIDHYRNSARSNDILVSHVIDALRAIKME
jgi:hypothetical protein